MVTGKASSFRKSLGDASISSPREERVPEQTDCIDEHDPMSRRNDGKREKLDEGPNAPVDLHDSPVIPTKELAAIVERIAAEK